MGAIVFLDVAAVFSFSWFGRLFSDFLNLFSHYYFFASALPCVRFVYVDVVGDPQSCFLPTNVLTLGKDTAANLHPRDFVQRKH